MYIHVYTVQMAQIIEIILPEAKIRCFGDVRSPGISSNIFDLVGQEQFGTLYPGIASKLMEWRS